MSDKIVPIEARVELPLVLIEVVSKVEERFVTIPDHKKVGEAKTEKQMKDAFEDQQSSGWWATLPRLGIALHVGATKPDLQDGDTICLNLSRMRRPGELGAVVATPSPAPAAAPAAEKVES